MIRLTQTRLTLAAAAAVMTGVIGIGAAPASAASFGTSFQIHPPSPIFAQNPAVFVPNPTARPIHPPSPIFPPPCTEFCTVD